MSQYEHDIRLIKARANLIMSQPFFGSLCIRMGLVNAPDIAKDSEGNPTMAVDGKNIYYHPDFLNNKTPRQLLTVLAHEVLHVAFMHHTRRGHRHPVKWNIAGDYAINLILHEIESFELPQPCLLDKKYKDMGAEEIYATFPKDMENSDEYQSMISQVAGMGIVMPVQGAPGQSQEQAIRQAEAELKVSLAVAATQARKAGKLPANLERLIEEILEPVVPWKDVLRRFMTERSPGDISWAAPSRRSYELGAFIPSRTSSNPHMKDIVLAIDTSGSIGPRELAEFGAEVNAIHKDLQPRRTVVIYCDADINGEPDVFMPYDEVVLEPRGGGGTDFRPPFEYVEDNALDPQCFVYLTDGFGEFPAENTVKYPVMWAMTSDVEPPFGETLHLDRSSF